MSSTSSPLPLLQNFTLFQRRRKLMTHHGTFNGIVKGSGGIERDNMCTNAMWTIMLNMGNDVPGSILSLIHVPMHIKPIDHWHPINCSKKLEGNPQRRKGKFQFANFNFFNLILILGL